MFALLTARLPLTAVSGLEVQEVLPQVIVHQPPKECPSCRCQRIEQVALSSLDKLRGRIARFHCPKCSAKAYILGNSEKSRPAKPPPARDPFLAGGYEYLLGNKYSKGAQVPQNDVLAFENYLASAKLGNPHGQFHTGLCYHEGKGVAADPMLAYYWVGRAAEQGQGQAVRLLPELEHLFEHAQMEHTCAEPS